MDFSDAIRIRPAAFVFIALSCGGTREGSAPAGGAGATGAAPGTFLDGGQSGTGPCPECEVTTCAQAAADKSTMGCEFLAVPPDSLTITRGACFAAFLVNTANTNVAVEVEYAGQKLQKPGFMVMPKGQGASLTYEPLPASGLPPGQVAMLFLSRSNSTACPSGITPAMSVLTSVSRTGKGAAFRIKTSAPVVAYDIYPYGGGPSAITSATLLLPTAAWDTNYIAVSGYQKSAIVEEDAPTLAIVAAEDGTNVTINPTVAIVGGGGVDAAPKGAPKTYALARGQILQFAQDQELTGSAISSDKPIGVWGGSICATINEQEGSACDTTHQQIPPVRAMGNEFAAVRYRNRFDGKEESPPWRLVGAVDGTSLSWEPSAPPGAPTTLKQGQVVEFASPGPWVVRSQDAAHPFYLSGHMTGWGAVSTAGDNRGDPEFVNVVPTAQFLKSYVFFTDPTYPETNLVVVRAKEADGWKDVALDCEGPLKGWQPLGPSGKYEFTRVDLMRGNFQKQGNCDNGRRQMKSEGPFGLTVWGWGSAATGGAFGGGLFSQAVSYAYPAGGSLKPINDVVVPVAVPK